MDERGMPGIPRMPTLIMIGFVATFFTLIALLLTVLVLCFIAS